MENGTVLLVDDEQGLLDLLTFALRNFWIPNLLTATTAHEALELITCHDVSLIVLDVMLPDGDGFEVCRQIRHVSEASVLLLTAKNQDIHKTTTVTSPYATRRLIYISTM